MSHYAVNAGVPKTLIQHLIRWVVAERPASSDDAGEVLREILDQEISPELVPVAEGERAAEHRGRDRPLRAAGLHPLPRAAATASRPSRIAFLAQHAWRRRRPGAVAARLRRGPPHVVRPRRRSGAGSRCSCKRFFGFSQFKRSAMPNGPKVVAGGSLSPRGDWRAPSDGNARSGSTSWSATCRAELPPGTGWVPREVGRRSPRAKHGRLTLTAADRHATAQEALGWASRKTSFSAHSRSATCASCGSGSPTSSAT